MYKSVVFILLSIGLFSCKSKVQKTKPAVSSISESIYASGMLKSKNQYQAFAKANGVIEDVFVSEGDSVHKGQAILSISNEAQRLSRDNAELAAAFSDFGANQGRLNEAKVMIEVSLNKLKNDSMLYFRQKSLWEQKIGSKAELERRELMFESSKAEYYSANVRYNDLKRQLDFASAQSKKNLQISSKMTDDFVLRSEIDGIVYGLNKTKGEIVSAQTPLAVIGEARHFILEMQVDEYDILQVKVGQLVLVTLDSYKGKVFEAHVTKINPLMNERSKTFLVEAEFVQQPQTLYPNISFEANIVLQTKQNALLVPRSYLLRDSILIKSNGDSVVVKTGLKDYQKVEILSGISATDEISSPNP